MFDFNQVIKDEWRKLGFYYEFDKSVGKNEWAFYGSRQGLWSFVILLEKYTNKLTKNFISEHEHYGPYSYLKVMTWDKAIITEKFIAGTIMDLINFKNILTTKLAEAQIGQNFTIDKEYGTDNTAITIFFILEDNFDPVSMDKNFLYPE